MFAHIVNVDFTDETSVNQDFVGTIANLKQVTMLVANAWINGPVSQPGIIHLTNGSGR